MNHRGGREAPFSLRLDVALADVATFTVENDGNITATGITPREYSGYDFDVAIDNNAIANCTLQN